MAKADFVVKLGGSAITHKDAPLSPNMPTIELAGNELASINLCKNKVVLVYGGGSYGHYAAAKHVEGGRVRSPSGAAEIRAAMLSLTKVLTEVLIWKGLPIFCINPSGAMSLDNGRLVGKDCLFRTVDRALEAGLIPTIGGDVILGRGGEARIVSGDLLARLLAQRTGAKALLFGTDVDGVLDTDGRLLRRLSRSQLDSIMSRITAREGDVTGGMGGKLAEVKSYLEEGGKLAVIFNLAKEGRLSGIINGREVEGTYIGTSDRG